MKLSIKNIWLLWAFFIASIMLDACGKFDVYVVFQNNADKEMYFCINDYSNSPLNL